MVREVLCRTGSERLKVGPERVGGVLTSRLPRRAPAGPVADRRTDSVDALDAGVLIYAAGADHELGRRVRAWVPTGPVERAQPMSPAVSIRAPFSVG